VTEAQFGESSDSALCTEILLVYGSLRTGGIETLIVRIANFLVSSGVRVSVFCAAGGGLESTLDSQVNVIAYSETSDLMQAVKDQYKKRTNTGLLVMSFDPISAARALMVEVVLSKYRQIAHLSGVFHPRAYFMTGERKDRIYLNYLLARAVGKSRLFFMNSECRDSHANRWDIDLSSSPILALPINLADATWQPSDNPIVRVVSVGRLVDFKTYNLGAARVVRACLDRGIEVIWDIYGDGPLQASIIEEIKANDVMSHVRLMGVLDYSSFSAKVAEYDLFVGMGTAALEAAMVGVPTICATVDQATRCYGYLDNLPFGNVGELLANPPTQELADLIQDYSASGQAQRTLLSKQGRAAAEKYGMPKFAEALAAMTFNRQAKPNWLIKRSIAELYRFATESYAAKAARRHVSKKKGRA
jgi:glycosyltransferase involved in cell wall biosynthesis